MDGTGGGDMDTKNQKPRGNQIFGRGWEWGGRGYRQGKTKTGATETDNFFFLTQLRNFPIFV